MKWRGIVLAIVVVSAIIVNGQEGRPKPSPNQDHAQNISNPAPPSPQVVCVVNQPSSNQENNRAEGHPQGYFSRLISPENLPAIGLIGVGIWGILVALGTLNHMRESSERQLRAYVIPEVVTMLDGTMLDPPQPAKANIPGVPMFIKNSGQTPAYRVVSWAQITVILVRDENLLTVPPLPEQFSTTLGANGVFSKALWFDRPLGPNEIADIAIGVRAIYYYGRIEYWDAFKKFRFTNFRLRYIGQFPPVANAVFNFCEKGNDAS